MMNDSEIMKLSVDDILELVSSSVSHETMVWMGNFVSTFHSLAHEYYDWPTDKCDDFNRMMAIMLYVGQQSIVGKTTPPEGRYDNGVFNKSSLQYVLSNSFPGPNEVADSTSALEFSAAEKICDQAFKTRIGIAMHNREPVTENVLFSASIDAVLMWHRMHVHSNNTKQLENFISFDEGTDG